MTTILNTALTIELTMALYTVIFFIILISIQGGVSVAEYGLVKLAGARDNLAEPKSVWLGRLKRTVNNNIEGLIMFIPLVLFAHAIGLSNDNTQFAAQLFLVSRVLHAGLYIFGIPWLRTLAFFSGLIALFIFIVELLSV